MIRLEKLILDDMRNIRHGELAFDDLPQGGSVTGIYGQNGSGKTTVIDAIGLLRCLLSGRPLPQHAGDVINTDTHRATMTVRLRIEREEKPVRWLEYRTVLQQTEPDDMGAKVLEEAVRIGEDPKHMGRELVSHRLADLENGRFEDMPAYVWRSICSVPLMRQTIERTAERAWAEGTSFLFARRAAMSGWTPEYLFDLISDMMPPDGMAARSVAYIDSAFKEFAELRQCLCEYALNDIFVSTTRRSNYASYSFIPIMEETPEGKEESLFDLLKPNPLTPREADRLERTVASFDRILPTLIPGLGVELRTRPAPSGDDGEDRIMAELFSKRGDSMVPFRCESEGIIRITALLGYLKHAYNDPSALVAVDEIDAGVFEFLLGDMLTQLADGCVGQLVFTAHNLRALELLPGRCIRTTGTDNTDRFLTMPRKSASNNQRKRYLDASEFGWQGPDIYDAPLPRMFGNGLYLASHPEELDE